MSEKVASLDAYRAAAAAVEAKNVKLEHGGGGPHDGGMPPDDPINARVAVLEHIAKETSETLKGLRSDVAALRVDMGEMKGKIANLPTAWTMVTTIVGSMVGLLVGLAGLGLAAAKYFGPAGS